MPAKGNPQPRPDKSDLLAYGKYMTNASGCRECHTPVRQGQIIPELAYSGGREFYFPDGSVLRSSNLTPDVETGIGSMTKEAFVQRFKVYADSAFTLPQVAAGEFNSIMPWTMYAQMEQEDLEAIYSYLHSVPATTNQVEKFSAASVDK